MPLLVYRVLLAWSDVICDMQTTADLHGCEGAFPVLLTASRDTRRGQGRVCETCYGISAAMGYQERPVNLVNPEEDTLVSLVLSGTLSFCLTAYLSSHLSS